jgi:hypothetical protein
MKLLSSLVVLSIAGAALVPVIALRYSYDTASAAGSAIGFLAMLVVAWVLWTRRRPTAVDGHILAVAIPVGVILGLMWVVEIAVNNVIAPPLPARDLIDDGFWAVIAIGIVLCAAVCAYRTRSIRQGVAAGAWSGLVSGLLACCTGLLLIVFGMRFLISDPLNIAEWASRRSSSAAPAIAAYFAYETFAGAFLHLVILGVVMGVLLGGVGGPLGKSLAGRLSPQNSEVGSRSGATMAAGGSHVQRRPADPERP